MDEFPNWLSNTSSQDENNIYSKTTNITQRAAFTCLHTYAKVLKTRGHDLREKGRMAGPEGSEKWCNYILIKVEKTN